MEIGAGTVLNWGALVAGRERTSIGRGATIPGRMIIHDTDWHPIPGQPGQGIKGAPVIIEDGAWSGASYIILKGACSGLGTVVRVGSVVIRDVLADYIAAGSPTRVIRELHP
jgi:acetyltransferase-like isoleucine patch superfamily enzyme